MTSNDNKEGVDRPYVYITCAVQYMLSAVQYSTAQYRTGGAQAPCYHLHDLFTTPVDFRGPNIWAVRVADENNQHYR